MTTKKFPPAILVTGGAHRIGRAVALSFADDGWDVALHYHSSAEEAKTAAGAIRRKGRKCVCFQASLDEPQAASALVRDAAQRFPGLKVLVHSASLFLPSGLGEDALLLFDRHMNIHVRAAWAMDAAFVRYVGKGSIIHFLDTRITANRTAFAAYLLSKKTLAELVRMSAAAFAPSVRVNAVAPGFILPPEGKDPRAFKLRAADIPLRRQGNVAHVTDAVKFLAGNDYITGQVIFVDGGEHLI